ncbi:putative major facilitator superfamily, MFS transporter superfamily [Helianthus annuus]|uniref:Major facilitator superfamily, MFS transporter superfamily n=1 Tax=Helianthus annuus TaxID=4232 RepID=A0A251UTP2_HELAN|nr:probable sphingolipid transporter spinster homolog 2 [Helianthus annuus]KAF5814475.1 putative major facilitator superfamily, MFS transporter superfamily [Helianthus annuus]KAJ0593082.1 putative major facilitator superfamily, MFS transporter superfamily [Helianthus annuus]KAJ0608094.1 putative major facilitator superfamily, MFS transporter superfamily [Helianthus annuus]KAJ0768159.1 putative major facilitator superfamily, MFS transporter superfamily [Helianthus annuus]KAJ0773933.1 putative m
MAIDSSDLSEPAPSWFTPKRLLVVFCVINMVNYVDRGAIASNGVNGSPRSCTESGVCSDGSGIQGDFDLNNFRDGVISSAFMVGLLVASPIFASLAKSINPFRLIGVGLSVWTLAAAGCGLSVDFWSITFCRMLVGVGEASFISLAAPFIDDNAPVAQRTAWLGIFYMCIPTGIAVGYVYGGVVGGSAGWRYAFFGEAILMLPFAILGFTMKPLQMKGMSHDKKVYGSLDEEVIEHSSKEHSSYGSFASNQLSRFWQDIKALLLEKIYVINVLGYIAYNFVIGAYSYWGPKAGYSIYQMNNADILFGGITIVGGIVGTLGGSIILDRMNSTIPNAFKLLSTATFFGAIFCFSAFCFSNLYIYLVLFLIGEILVFATQGPVNFVCLHTVKPSLRPLSMAMSTVSIHVFGDVPSSPLVGLLQDKVDNWRISALILTSVFFLAAGIWFIGIFLDSVDRYDEGSEHAGSVIEQPDVMPLLENKPATASP